MMFEKKDIIYSSTMGLVVVKDVTKLSADRRAPMLYYVLRSFYDKDKTAYIPVEEHEVELRNIYDKKRAEEELEDILESGVLWDEELEKRVGEIAYILEVAPDALKKRIIGEEDE